MAQPLPPLEYLTLVPSQTRDAEVISEFTAHDREIAAWTTVEREWTTYADGRPLLHQVQSIELQDEADGTRHHRRLHTEPLAAVEPVPYGVVNLLGWTESIDTPLVQNMHAHLSMLNPGAQVTTEATYGIDGTADNLSLLGKAMIDQETMALKTFEMMRAVHGTDPLVLTGTSQGGNTAAIINRLNEALARRNDPYNPPLRIEGFVLYEPYQGRTQKHRIIRAGQFFGHVILDHARELCTRTSPADIPGVLRDEVRSGPRPKDAVALIAQGWSLLGTENYELLRSLGANHTVKVQGDRDCFTCPEVDAMPGFTLVGVPGKGHGMGMHALKRAVGKTKAIRRLNLAAA